MKAVIFDLDDTLYPEKSYCLSGYRVVAGYLEKKGIGSEEDNFALLSCLFKEDAKMLFNRFFDKIGVKYSPDDIKELIRVYREHEPRIEFFPDVMPALEALKAEKYLLGILSDGFALAQRNKVRALNCGEYFDKIILTDELGRDAWKPSAKGFELLEAEYKIPAEEILYVGDNPSKDFYLKISAGIKTARIIRSDGVYRDTPYYENVHEDYTLDSLTDIMEKIK